MTRDEAIRRAWRAGRLEWKLRRHQLEVIQAAAAYPGDIFFVNQSRQTGKTTTQFIGACEDSIRTPGHLTFFAAHSLKATKDILRITAPEVLADCPDSVRPRVNEAEGFYEFPNGSVIMLGGLDDGRAENYRGRKAHKVRVDEAGSVSNLGYVVRSILYPMLKTTRGKMVVSSTPPVSPAHEFRTLCAEAEERGGYICKTVHDDPTVTPEDVARWSKECGGVDSSDWKREYLCQFVTDTKRAVLPEFTDDAARDMVQPLDVPPYFHPIVAMDVGFRDLTFVLFGYYDFLAARLCIQDEIVVNGPAMTTDALAASIRAKEAELWPGRKVDYRFSDVEPILLNDLSVLHSLPFIATSKDDKEAQVNNLRLWVKQRKIRIAPKCTRLVRQMKTAIWNEKRSDFERLPNEGHADGVDALVYMLRNTPVHENPYPDYPAGVTTATHWIPAKDKAAEHELGKLFGFGGKR